jgi:hypothetical protein
MCAVWVCSLAASTYLVLYIIIAVAANIAITIVGIMFLQPLVNMFYSTVICAAAISGISILTSWKIHSKLVSLDVVPSP